MKKLIYLFLTLLFTTSLLSQERTLLNTSVRACAWDSAIELKEVYAWETDPDDMVREYIKKICAEQNIEPNFKIMRANVPNALSTLDDKNNRVIFYSLSFFQSTESMWFKMAVLAHEVGHFLNYHNFNSTEKRPSDELVADQFAGFILAKLNAPIDDVKKLMDIHCSTQGNEFYPPKSARIEAVVIGYEKGKKKREEEYDEKEKNLKKMSSLENIDCSEYYQKKTLAAEEFDGKNTITYVGGIQKHGFEDGYLEVAPQTEMSVSNYDYSTINNYDLETQISFHYDGNLFDDDIEQKQYFIWDGGIRQNVIKGYYFTIYREKKFSLSEGKMQYPHTYLQVGYMDGQAKTILIDAIEIDYRFYDSEKYLNFLVRKANGYFYIFVDGVFKEKVKITNYTAGKGFGVVNNVPLQENRYGEVYTHQLTFLFNVKVNYVRLYSLAELPK